MQLVNIVLTEKTYVRDLLELLQEDHFHGSVVETKSIHHALLDADGSAPMFGGLTKVVGDEAEELARPIIQVVIMNDHDIAKISQIVHKVIPSLNGKGFIYVVPVTYVEGLR